MSFPDETYTVMREQFEREAREKKCRRGPTRGDISRRQSCPQCGGRITEYGPKMAPGCEDCGYTP